ncbi:NAD(P)-dependent oxidoreductase [Yunchengibacter salinarum]|uniref:NAD(P)-dependent oxidoreductase n=1 Tax=Yunchengibacter salinarum TaxID=3133399 RepID=UPI0035B5F8CD
MSDGTYTLAFIGLGVMGYPMAGHLARAGHRVTVYNRTFSRAAEWLEAHGGLSVATAETPAEAARDAHMVFMCVGADRDVEAVTLGADGALDAMKSGAILVDHTTASAGLARRLATEAAGRDVAFLDAPVSGGQAGAENGQLTIMCGGDAAAFETARPVMALYGRRVQRLGEAGAGQLTKMANQVCIAGTLQGLSEALVFAEQAGLDGAAVVDVISGGAAQSWQMDNRALTMLEDRFDFGFAVDWMRKDLAMVLDEARQRGLSLPLTALVDQFYADVQALGLGRGDTSALIRRLRHALPDRD